MPTTKSYTKPSSSLSPSSSSTISTIKPDQKRQVNVNEDTPLIKHNDEDGFQLSKRSGWNIFGPVQRVYFTTLLLAMTFAFTQTSLIYSFRVMTCDEYYKTHKWDGGNEDKKCNIPYIESKTAKEIALMSTTTTMSMVVNIFISGWFIKRFGVKAAMFQQSFWATLRNLTQIYSLNQGGKLGITIIQSSQAFNILGSAGGYQIASNVYISMLVKPEERTKQFGVLAGIIMLGNSLGYSFGGIAYNLYGLLAPFQCAFALLCFCTIFGILFLPYMTPESHTQSKVDDQSAEKQKQSFLAPLKLFIPRKSTNSDGRTKRDYNLFLIASGTFFSVLATGYVHVALQLVGTDVFGFTPNESGMMLSGNLFVRAIFLSICFPRIITYGRKLLSHRTALSTTDISSSDEGYAEENHLEESAQAEQPDDLGVPRDDQARRPTDLLHGSTFDLYFLRWSIFIDGLLTGLTTLSTKGWHLYLAAGVLPFASATGSATKGVTLDFVRPDQRADALSAIALIEKLAQVITISLFGYIFALFSEQGQPTLIFLANGAIAMLAFLLLLFVRMPRPDTDCGRIALPA
ncbi:uncharacterized protein L201_001894 [Kwoniella dendrophila CBS 6074]|uniref:Major facilitator superfamily (MFS) profile domain-containing protein n=1 Tax=Kwoniella dendrophila CBS 6074 TaxID=1295534 RepID=A0AAX4JNN5_9TREE